MELPIQLKFFKKLELYQELKFYNKKSSKASDRLRKMWKTEKLILRWTVWHHHLLNCPIGHGYVRDNIFKDESKEYDVDLSGTFGNLIEKNYAYLKFNDSTDILFTPEGLLMGEVIDDVEGSAILSQYKYDLFYYLVWITAISGALIVIINFFVLVYKGLSGLFSAVIHY